MRTVLYAHDMEPITVFELKPWAHDFLMEHGSVRLAIQTPVNASVDLSRASPPSPMPTMDRFVVHITAERFMRNGKQTLFLFTHDEEAALLLKADFLPGQVRGVQEIERGAYAIGFLAAINAIGR